MTRTTRGTTPLRLVGRFSRPITATISPTEDSSPSVEGENGKGVVSTTYATVIFDQNNIIRKVYIDEVESKIYFDSKGQLSDKAENIVRSKRELGDSYGMKAASPIGKEWYEQINSLESWLVGRNIADISNGVINMDNYGADNNYSNDMANGNDSAGNMANNVADGAKNIVNGVVDGIVNGARDIVGNNTTSDGTNTAEGITNNTESNITGDTQNNSTPSVNSGTDSDNSMNNNNTVDNALDWEEDLKASVTIDLTNIQRALHKAYMNAK